MLIWACTVGRSNFATIMSRPQSFQDRKCWHRNESTTTRSLILPELVQGQGNSLACGDVAAAFESSECERVIEGEARLGGQEHFYLEPQCSVVIPGEHQEFTIISSSQVIHDGSDLDLKEHPRICVLADRMHLRCKASAAVIPQLLTIRVSAGGLCMHGAESLLTGHQ